jgi:hypothetical protein
MDAGFTRVGFVGLEALAAIFETAVFGALGLMCADLALHGSDPISEIPITQSSRMK